MKLKLWQFEYDFDRDDAKIVVPIILLALAICFTQLDSALLICAGVIYYAIYFFGAQACAATKERIQQYKMRCPNCRDRKIILQGYEGYKSDEHYPYYLCDNCGTTSILTDGGLLQINPPRQKVQSF
jgi:hypothetical protein